MNERLRTAPGWDIIEGDYYEAGEGKPACAYERRAFSAPESLFALADGYLGLRGAAEEIPRSPGDGRGTYVNGYYERSPIAYGEDAYGYARWHETIVDLPDGLGVELEIDGRPLAAYGRFVGMAFQIVDDIINLCPDEGDNKDAFNDILEGKYTLPLVILFQQRPEVLRKVTTLPDPEEQRLYLMAELSPEILRLSRDKAREYLDGSIQALHRARLHTDALANVPVQIIGQVSNRF